MDIIQGKLNAIIELLEQLVDQRNVDIEIGRPPSLNSLSITSGESSIEEEEEEIVQYNSIQIGEFHRLIEIKDERTNEINLHIQYFNGDNWGTKHTF